MKTTFILSALFLQCHSINYPKPISLTIRMNQGYGLFSMNSADEKIRGQAKLAFENDYYQEFRLTSGGFKASLSLNRFDSRATYNEAGIVGDFECFKH